MWKQQTTDETNKKKKITPGFFYSHRKSQLSLRSADDYNEGYDKKTKYVVVFTEQK